MHLVLSGPGVSRYACICRGVTPANALAGAGALEMPRSSVNFRGKLLGPRQTVTRKASNYSKLDRILAGKSDEPAGVIEIFTVDNIHSPRTPISFLMVLSLYCLGVDDYVMTEGLQLGRLSRTDVRTINHSHFETVSTNPSIVVY